MPKAAVLPVPVWAWPITSTPASAGDETRLHRRGRFVAGLGQGIEHHGAEAQFRELGADAPSACAARRDADAQQFFHAAAFRASVSRSRELRAPNRAAAARLCSECGLAACGLSACGLSEGGLARFGCAEAWDCGRAASGFAARVEDAAAAASARAVSREDRRLCRLRRDAAGGRLLFLLEAFAVAGKRQVVIVRIEIGVQLGGPRWSARSLVAVRRLAATPSRFFRCRVFGRTGMALCRVRSAVVGMCSHA